MEEMNSERNRKYQKLWVFLDEINTCDFLGLLCEIITMNRFQGRSLPDNI